MIVRGIGRGDHLPRWLIDPPCCLRPNDRNSGQLSALPVELCDELHWAVFMLDTVRARRQSKPAPDAALPLAKPLRPLTDFFTDNRLLVPLAGAMADCQDK